MSETPTVAEQAAAPPPPEGSSSGDQRPPRQPLAYLLTHQSGVVIVVALVIALLVGAVLIRYQGVNPWYAYETLIREAILVEGGLTRTLQKTAPLVLTGLAVVIPLRVGLFNIGGQGQLIFGAMFGAWAAYALGGLGFVGALAGMVAGIAAGAFIGWIAGVLKATRGVHEVITTIMLNYIAAGVTWWLVTGPLQAESSKTSGIPQTELIAEEARVGAVAGIPIGFVIAVALAIACWWMLSKTTLGFRLNTVGANKHAAGYAGISIKRIIALSMVLGGGLAGLAGALEAGGTLHRFEPAIGGTLGFDGITIALLARANPLATLPAAFLVGVLRTGAPGLQFATGIAPEIVDLLLAIILLMVSIPVLGKWIFRSRADKVTAASTSWGN
ncbi:ABC transporter permease [Fodinibacter luteus]|uniref:ABC transporter permease n=1 Tax=Fodinibacter luteus TaxID=552064 RepID=A0ABP8KLE8_9MICO